MNDEDLNNDDLNDDDKINHLDGKSDLSSLYAESKSGTPIASESVDLAILAAAKRSVSTQPTALEKPSIRRWGIPASVAATVLLSTTIYLTNQQEIDSISVPEAYSPTEAPIRQETNSQSNNNAKADKEESARVIEKFSADADAPLNRTTAPLKKKATAVEIHKDRAQSPAPAAISGTLDDEAGVDITWGNKTAVEKTAAEESMVGKAAETISDTELSKDTATLLRYRAESSAPSSSQVRSQASSQKSTDMMMEAETQAKQGGSATAVVPQKSPVMSENKVRLSKQTPGRMSAPTEAIAADYRSTPERWISHIEALVQSAEAQSADLSSALDELEAFQVRYPNYPLPETLVQLTKLSSPPLPRKVESTDSIGIKP